MIRCASIGSVNCYVYTTSNNAHNSFDVIVSFAIMQWQEFLKSNKMLFRLQDAKMSYFSDDMTGSINDLDDLWLVASDLEFLKSNNS